MIAWFVQYTLLRRKEKERERKHNVFIKDFFLFCFYDVCNVNSLEYESKHKWIQKRFSVIWYDTDKYIHIYLANERISRRLWFIIVFSKTTLENFV
jgi:hypothetical protein